MESGGKKLVELLLKTASDVRVASKAESQRTEKSAESIGVMVPYGQYRVLEALGAEGPMGQRALAKALGIRPASVSEAVSRLATMGLVERIASNIDGRAVEVALTADGEKSLAASREHAASFNEKILQPLDDRERAALMELLAKLDSGLIAQSDTEEAENE